MDLWNECLKGNPKAWRVMKKYNCIPMYLPRKSCTSSSGLYA
jgi:hypothetical protein